MKIGILGGSFNPVHQGHIYIAQLAIKKLGLNQVWMIPTAQNPLKSTLGLAPYLQRLEACVKSTKSYPKIRVKNFENDSIFTYDLVKKLRAKYPRARFVWVMGADNLREFSKWKKVDKLVGMVDFAVFSRLGGLPSQTIFRRRGGPMCPPASAQDLASCERTHSSAPTKTKTIFFKTKNYDISSTAIRDNRR